MNCALASGPMPPSTPSTCLRRSCRSIGGILTGAQGATYAMGMMRRIESARPSRGAGPVPREHAGRLRRSAGDRRRCARTRRGGDARRRRGGHARSPAQPRHHADHGRRLARRTRRRRSARCARRSWPATTSGAFARAAPMRRRIPTRCRMTARRSRPWRKCCGIDPAARFNIELKTFPWHPGLAVDGAAMADAVVAVADARGAAERIIVQSFDWRGPRRLRRTRPDIRLAWLTSGSFLAGARTWWDGPHPADFGGSVARAVAAEGGPTWGPDYADLTEETIAEAHALGLQGGAVDGEPARGHAPADPLGRGRADHRSAGPRARRAGRGRVRACRRHGGLRKLASAEARASRACRSGFLSPS